MVEGIILFDYIFNRIEEARHSALNRKQKSVYKLFPPFDKRVAKIGDMGGLRLKKTTKDTWFFKVHSGTKKNTWYENVMHFPNILKAIEKGVKDKRLWNKKKTGVDYRKLAKYVMYNSDVQLKCSCLVGSTKIPLLDGRTLTMEELAKEYPNEEKFWVYASDENGDFVPAQAISLGVTNTVSKLVRVTLDNGESIECTPDHLFRLGTGEYKMAGELSDGESLMPMFNHMGSRRNVAFIEHRELNVPVDVYDLSVDEYQNFAVDAGVYVHNCPADLFWGAQFIRSKDKYNANYGKKEIRPPKIRNPKQYSAYCKHLENLYKVLPFYMTTFAQHLKKHFSKEIEAWTKEFSDEMDKYKLAGKELGKKKDIKDEQDKKARKSTKDKAEEPEQEVDDSKEEEDAEKDA